MEKINAVSFAYADRQPTEIEVSACIEYTEADKGTHQCD